MDLSFSAEYEKFREQVRAFLAESWSAEDAAVEVNIGNMPFTGTVTEDQKDELFAWAMCGTP